MSRRAARRTATVITSMVITVTVLAGCARGAAESASGGPPIPTFGVSSSPGPPTTPGARRGTLLPQDCDSVVSHDLLPGLLGLPVDSVQVHTVIGIREPSVQRLERVSCQYTRAGQQPGDVSGGLVDLSMSAYADPTAARDHAAINIAAERKSVGAEGVASPIGDAPGVYFVDGALRLLIVTYGRFALTVTLHGGVAPDPSARAILMDLAQRVLPMMAG